MCWGVGQVSVIMMCGISNFVPSDPVGPANGGLSAYVRASQTLRNLMWICRGVGAPTQVRECNRVCREVSSDSKSFTAKHRLGSVGWTTEQLRHVHAFETLNSTAGAITSVWY